MDEAINSIQISEAQGNFLKAFVEMMSFKSVLEIGTLHGFSTSFFARALSVTDGKVVSIEKSEENFLVAQKKLEIYKNVHLILGDAMEVLPEISEKFDLIFIDANKSKYPDYLELAIKLLNEKGSIVLDNTLFRGYVFSVEYPKKYKKIVENLRKMHKTIEQLEGFESVTLDIEDGMTILKRK